ncbi:lactonase family protein [Rhizobium sp. KVB221]|uniref:Lactonase family protein n=1 Tax=Rhizobium setariae TaxID=2801340 RepID=A0A936YQC8_9HYPH|nr:lactonase family protein [Rhizobium setariae]
MQQLYLAVGTLNRETPYFQGARGRGVIVYAFDEDRLEWQELASSATADNPCYLAVSPKDGLIYSVSEVAEWCEGTATAFHFDKRTQELVYLNKQPTLGAISAYAQITADQRFLLVANYGYGNAGPDQSLVSFPFRPDGGLAPPSGSAAHEGAAMTVPERQERSHAHSIVEMVDKTGFLSADLGLDRIFSYRLTDSGGFALVSAVTMPEGSGPRHIAQHPGGRFVFVSNELNSTVSTLVRDGHDLRHVGSWPAAPEGVQNHPSDIHVSADGRFVYMANRGHDTIAIFRVDQQTGVLAPNGHVDCGGATPRSFVLMAGGRTLLVANQNGDNISIFRRDGDTGALAFTGKRIEVGTPMCVRPFLL